MKLSETQCQLLWLAFRYEVFDSLMASALLDLSPTTIRDNIRALMAEPLRALVPYPTKYMRFDFGGDVPVIVAPTNAGARALVESDVVGPALLSRDWNGKFKKRAPSKVPHRLLAGYAEAAAEVACRKRGLSFFNRHAMNDTFTTNTGHVITDDECRIITQGVPKGRLRRRAHRIDSAMGWGRGALEYPIFIESDASNERFLGDDAHMPHETMQKKANIYKLYGREQGHVDQYGTANFRYLTVTAREERIDDLIRGVKAASGGDGSRRALFVSHQQLRTALSRDNDIDLLSLPLCNAADELVELRHSHSLVKSEPAMKVRQRSLSFTPT